MAFSSSLQPDVPAIPNCSKTTRYVTIMEPNCNKITVVRVMEGNFVFFCPASCSWWEIFVALVKSLRLNTYSKKNEHCFIVTHGAVVSGVSAPTFQRMCPGSSETMVNIYEYWRVSYTRLLHGLQPEYQRSHMNPNLISIIFIAKDWATGWTGRVSNSSKVQGGSNMTGTDLCVNKPHCAAAVRP